MPTLEENVNRVKAAKTAIGNAITAKGGTVGANDGLEDFASDIASIPSGGVEFSNTPTTLYFKTNAILPEIQIPNGIISIGSQNDATTSGAFTGFSTIEKIKMADSVLNIGAFAFLDCSGLKSIELSDNITTIGSNAFNRCTSLETLEIPSKTTYIASSALRNLYSLKSLKFKSLTPPTFADSYVLASLPTTCTIYVPTGTLSDYTSASYYPSSSTYTYVEY